jgi:hypothetical protein
MSGGNDIATVPADHYARAAATAASAYTEAAAVAAVAVAAVLVTMAPSFVDCSLYVFLQILF